MRRSGAGGPHDDGVRTCRRRSQRLAGQPRRAAAWSPGGSPRRQDTRSGGGLGAAGGRDPLRQMARPRMGQDVGGRGPAAAEPRLRRGHRRAPGGSSCHLSGHQKRSRIGPVRRRAPPRRPTDRRGGAPQRSPGADPPQPGAPAGGTSVRSSPSTTWPSRCCCNRPPDSSWHGATRTKTCAPSTKACRPRHGDAAALGRVHLTRPLRLRTLGHQPPATSHPARQENPLAGEGTIPATITAWTAALALLLLPAWAALHDSIRQQAPLRSSPRQSPEPAPDTVIRLATALAGCEPRLVLQRRPSVVDHRPLGLWAPGVDQQH